MENARYRSREANVAIERISRENDWNHANIYPGKHLIGWLMIADDKIWYFLRSHYQKFAQNQGKGQNRLQELTVRQVSSKPSVPTVRLRSDLDKLQSGRSTELKVGRPEGWKWTVSEPPSFPTCILAYAAFWPLKAVHFQSMGVHGL